MTSSGRSSSSRSSTPLAPEHHASAAAISARSRTTRARSRATPGLLLVALTLLPGCYLGHVTAGQARLLWDARPLEEWLADDAADPDVRGALATIGPVREFASALGLEVGWQYRSYTEWPGDRVVTTVVAAEPGSVRAVGFWFPLLGRLPYKGYFDPARAEREAERLRARGLDVCVVAVPAYSTLGWLPDPVTGPMLRAGTGWLVETLLHELVHATVYAAGDADFNEGVATFIGQEAAVRFFEEHEGPEAGARERRRVERARATARVVSALREDVDSLYASRPAGPDREQARAALEAAARRSLAALPDGAGGDGSSAALAREARLNDACLALAGAYEADLDAYEARLAALGGDLPAFVAAAREAAGAREPRTALLAAPAAVPGG